MENSTVSITDIDLSVEKRICYYYSIASTVFNCSTSISTSSKYDENTKNSTSCCVISFEDDRLRSDFIRDYHGRHWIDSEGMEIPRRCFVTPVKVVKMS
uniref:RRM domain-containing protein n=1 Tax=Heterorhabditis bacteriophora TaxID=37862 RepID=A0A1I7XKZ2_HETBA